MEISQLRYFGTVARTGSVRKAAELLRVTPAALSKSIGNLERELGEKLLLPAGRGIVVSDVGIKLAARISSLLAELDRLRDDVAGDASPSAHVLRIASFEVFTTWLFGPVVEKYFPDTSVLVHEMLPGQMESAIEQRTADIGITYLPIPSAKVEHLKVATIEMGVYGRADVFAKVAFEKLPFAIPISPVAGSPNKVRGLDGWPDDRMPRHILYRVTLMESAMELCRRGLAVAYLPAPVVRCHNDLVRDRFALSALPFPRISAASARQEVFLIKRKSDVESQSFKRLAAAMRAATTPAHRIG